MPLPVISVAQMREWEERTWAAGVSAEAVMKQAGGAVAGWAANFADFFDPSILFLIGKGNNGGDARIAAEILMAREFNGRIQVLEVSDGTEVLPDLSDVALVVDGLFGIGLNRELSVDWCEFINKLNAVTHGLRIPVLSVDVPSGLDADSGQPRGASVRADYTLTFGAPKCGLISDCAAEFVGHLEVAAEIGFVDAPPLGELRWVGADDSKRFAPKRLANSHKGTFGHVGIIAGSMGYHGAAVLAARAAESSGVGLVSVFTPAYAPVAAQLQSAMVHPWDANVVHTLSACTAVVIGPGLAGPDVPESLRQVTVNLWRESENPIVVDASALEWIANEPIPENAVRVVTPHPGEVARFLDTTAGIVQTDRMQAMRKVSAICGGAITVHKGRHTLVGGIEGPVSINSSGNPHLAQGGSGDVLAGHLGGWLARKDLESTPMEIVVQAVWRHGAAADNLSSLRHAWGLEALLSNLETDFDC
ncbi:MAG: NAD(P)H-hydrate dehydratase [Verrucomicrobia subdivision 3 bacterium]|nr:NAD(P)H-hydrate dehydratase [Limisphaerales bacterium]